MNTDDKGLFKMRVPIEQDEEGFPPFQSELLWVKPVDGNFVVQNIPFYCTGISFGDVVSASSQEGEIVFTSVLQASGHSTIQIVFFEDAHFIQNACQHLVTLGCDYEVSNLTNYISVNVPPAVDWSTLKTYLDTEERNDSLSYREACLG